MFLRSWVGVVTSLVLFGVYAVLLGWPESTFSLWVHRLEPLWWVLGAGIVVAAATASLRKE
jgi:hypothetical protein